MCNSKRTDKDNRRHDIHNKRINTLTPINMKKKKWTFFGEKNFIKVTQKEIENQNAPQTAKEIDSVPYPIAKKKLMVMSPN